MTGNEVNAIGVFFLIVAHSMLSFFDTKDKIAFSISGVGALIVAYGSFLLGSWPIVILNIIWCYLSFNKVFNNSNNKFLFIKDRKNVYEIYRKYKTVIILLTSLSITGILVAFGHNGVAMLGVTIYFVTYALLVSSMMNKRDYLIASVIGFLFIAPHLIIINSWPVLFNESIGFVVAIIGVLRICLSQSFDEKELA